MMNISIMENYEFICLQLHPKRLNGLNDAKLMEL